MATKLQTEAFILAGGKSSRMGRDKGLIEINRRPMIAYLIETLHNLGLETSIVSNNSYYGQFGLPVLPDIIKDQGPLGGLYTAMHHAKAANVLLLSCDMPFIGEEALQKLLGALQPDQIVATLMNGHLNPMPAIYPCRLEEQVKSLILAQKLKMSRWLSEQNPVVVALDNKLRSKETNDSGYFGEEFININTPDDLLNLSHKHRKTGEKLNKTKDSI